MTRDAFDLVILRAGENTLWPLDILEAKQHAHQLPDQLGPDQVAAVLQLLEVMVNPDEEPLTEEERTAVNESREYFRRNPASGVLLDAVAAECGFTLDQLQDCED